MEIKISVFWGIQENPGIYKICLDEVAANDSQAFTQPFPPARCPGFCSSPSWPCSLGAGHMTHIFPPGPGNQTQPCTHVLASRLLTTLVGGHLTFISETSLLILFLPGFINWWLTLEGQRSWVRFSCRPFCILWHGHRMLW